MSIDKVKPKQMFLKKKVKFKVQFKIGNSGYGCGSASGGGFFGNYKFGYGHGSACGVVVGSGTEDGSGDCWSFFSTQSDKGTG